MKLVVFDTRLKARDPSYMYVYSTCISPYVVGQEGVLCSGRQRRPVRPAVGQSAAQIRWNADHHGLHQHTEKVLQVSHRECVVVATVTTPLCVGGDGRVGGADYCHVERCALVQSLHFDSFFP